jgi:transposase
MEKKRSAENAVREIRRTTRRRFSAEEEIRIVIEGLRGKESIASLFRREGIAVIGIDFGRSRMAADII